MTRAIIVATDPAVSGSTSKTSYAMKKVRDLSCGTMHELAIALEKAGFTAEDITKIINSKGNEIAKNLLKTLNQERVAFAERLPQRYEKVLVTDYIPFTLDELKKIAASKWNCDSSNVIPPHRFEEFTCGRIILFKVAPPWADFDECRLFLRSLGNHVTFPNIYGLALLDKIESNGEGQLIPDFFQVLGLDEDNNLPIGSSAYKGSVVPMLCRTAGEGHKLSYKEEFVRANDSWGDVYLMYVQGGFEQHLK